MLKIIPNKMQLNKVLVKCETRQKNPTKQHVAVTGKMLSTCFLQKIEHYLNNLKSRLFSVEK